jgi:hypothetical protein
VYSVTLALSIITLLLSLCGSLIAKFKPELENYHLQEKSKILAIISLILVLFSLIYHLFTGHAPGSEIALNFLEFLREHPAFWIALILSSLPLFLNSAQQKSVK